MTLSTSPPVWAQLQSTYMIWYAGVAFNATMGAGAFTDPQGLPLTYSATMTDGSALPSWVSFNAANASFSGIVPSSYQSQNASTLSFVLTATDSAGLSASETYTANIYKVYAPSQSDFAPAPHILPGSSFSVREPADIFSDPQNFSMTYSATAANGGPLPGWMSFDPGTMTFSGTVPSNLRGSYVAELHATNSAGQTGTVYFTIWLTAGPPNLVLPTPDQSWAVGQPLNLALPAGSFVDPQNEALAYSITGANGQQIPSWLHFNNSSLTFTGTPPNSEAGQSLGIQLTATNSDKQSTTDSFTVTFTGQSAPILVMPTSAQSWGTGQPVSFNLPAGSFTDPHGSALTYAAKLANGGSLPSWLQFDPSTQSFSGLTPGTAATLAIEIDATNSSGATTGDVFSVTIGQPNPHAAPPSLTDPTVSHYGTAGSLFTLTLPADTFTDPQGLALTYAATEADGMTPLPSWLNFNAKTLTFSGIVPASGADFGVEVTATNSAGVSSSETFVLGASQASSGFNVEVSGSIPISTFKVGQPIAITLPSGMFSDQQGLPLTFSGALLDGSALPSWLKIDPATGNVSGTAPLTAQSIQVAITATDTAGSSGMRSFILNVPGPLAPQLHDGPGPDQVWAAGQSVDLALPADSFIDPQGEALTFSAALSNGSALPSWLQFNAATQTFSGTVPNSASPLTITVTATDSSGLSGSETFGVNITGVSSPPPTTSTSATITGDGYQVITIGQSRAGYSATANGDGSFTFVTPTGSEHVSGVMQVQFTDATYTVAAKNSLNEFVALLYQGALDHTPDAAGLKYWEQTAAALPASAQSSGAYALSDASNIAASFVAAANLDGLSDAQFVTQVYQNALYRTPDAGGLAAWTSALANGTTRAHVLIGIAGSAEAINDATTGTGPHASWLFLT